MDLFQKLKNLSSQMHLEPAEDAGCTRLAGSPKMAGFASNAVLPGGRRITLLKTLLTSACERNCYYCPFRAGRDFHRATLKPEEMARIFTSLHQKSIVEGLFLSSGIVAGGLSTQDKLIETAEILRKKHSFNGYVHLKIMPGVEKEQVRRAMQLVDRVSINLEAPNDQRLSKFAPRKLFMEELMQPLRWIEEIRRESSSEKGWKGRWPSSTTQFVVGGAGESDLELLSTTEQLYQQMGIQRAYFSAFSPVPDTPLENLPPAPPEREHRLYQASFLLRDYGFTLEELPFNQMGDLPRHTDPKLSWAEIHLSAQPIEVNRADRYELLRIPGVGPKAARAILAARKQGRIQDISDLQKIGINSRRAAAFILLDGQRPTHQPRFWQ